jgi:hypothetical protein
MGLLLGLRKGIGLQLLLALAEVAQSIDLFPEIAAESATFFRFQEACGHRGGQSRDHVTRPVDLVANQGEYDLCLQPLPRAVRTETITT